MNAAAQTDRADDLSDGQRRGRRLRFELIFVSVWLAFGLFLLPALIFCVGGAVFGPYGENAGLSTFYIDFFEDLADASGRAWSIALGPLLVIYPLRAIFLGVQSDRLERERFEDEAPVARSRAPAKREHKRSADRPTRIEPRMSGD